MRESVLATHAPNADMAHLVVKVAEGKMRARLCLCVLLEDGGACLHVLCAQAPHMQQNTLHDMNQEGCREGRPPTVLSPMKQAPHDAVSRTDCGRRGRLAVHEGFSNEPPGVHAQRVSVVPRVLHERGSGGVVCATTQCTVHPMYLEPPNFRDLVGACVRGNCTNSART